MSFLDKMQQRAKAVLDKQMEDLRVADDIRETRLNICNSCEFLFVPTGSCKKCGCFVKAKTMIKSASCPIQKWNSEK